jgi:hypothetical protein
METSVDEMACSVKVGSDVSGSTLEVGFALFYMLPLNVRRMVHRSFSACYVADCLSPTIVALHVAHVQLFETALFALRPAAFRIAAAIVPST